MNCLDYSYHFSLKNETIRRNNRANIIVKVGEVFEEKKTYQQKIRVMASQVKEQRILPSVENIKADLNRIPLMALKDVIGSATMLSNISKRYSIYLSKFLKQSKKCGQILDQSIDENSLNVIFQNNLGQSIGLEKKPIR